VVEKCGELPIGLGGDSGFECGQRLHLPERRGDKLGVDHAFGGEGADGVGLAVLAEEREGQTEVDRVAVGHEGEGGAEVAFGLPRIVGQPQPAQRGFAGLLERIERERAVELGTGGGAFGGTGGLFGEMETEVVAVVGIPGRCVGRSAEPGDEGEVVLRVDRPPRAPEQLAARQFGARRTAAAAAAPKSARDRRYVGPPGAAEDWPEP
jgi:hypothetical protein